MALWGGRFKQQPSELFKQFNDSLPVDYRLVEQDIVASISWAKALQKVSVISSDEYSQLEDALTKLLEEVQSGQLNVLDSDAEDIHSWVEQHLIAKVGDLGKKLHTGRSRNDQVATDLKLWCKEKSGELLAALVNFQQALMELATREKSAVLPGYTHLQRAQPITFGHWCLAYVEMFDRDIGRLNDALYRLDTSPLGSGALAGTAYPIDRQSLAMDLGFRRPTLNSLDAVSDRDHVIELLSAASISTMHLSRFAEDLIFYNSGEAGFIELSDQVTSGSSLMPQKKNPDALELIRGKSGRVMGALNGILVTMKGLPLAYNKDMQEDKEGLFDALDTWQISLQMAQLVVQGLRVNHTATLAAAQQGYANATELADYLVGKDIPFREAHHIVGEVVLYAIEQEKALEDCSLSELQKFSDQIEHDVFQHLTIESCLSKRQALGGTSITQVEQALEQSLQAQEVQGSQVLGSPAAQQIQITLRQAQQRLNAQKASVMNVRRAKMTDVDSIERIVRYWADKGETLPRSRDNIVHDIQNFVVAEKDHRIIGCACLYIYQTGLAEIRSVGVTETEQGCGQGSAMIQYLMEQARHIQLKRVIVLTRVPDFFGKLGFLPTKMDSLPEKVIKDCDICPKKHACDEVAMEYLVQPFSPEVSESLLIQKVPA